MMTKIAHMRENRKNNKGFSLVELIIVIAIMVALIAVMGPQYVKYVQKSRDSAVASAAEDLESYIKSAIADPDTNLKVKSGSSATVTVQVTGGKLAVAIAGGGLSATGKDTVDVTWLGQQAGFSNGASMGQSGKVYTITITGGDNPTVTMAGA